MYAPPRWHAHRLRAGAALTIGLAVLGVGVAQASPLDLFGFGGRSPAMAGAGVATTTDYAAVYLNPAGLADTAGKRFTLGTMHSRFYLELDGSSADVAPASGVVIGGALPLPLGGALKDRVGLGLGFHVPTTALNRAKHPLPGVPSYVLLDSRAHVIGFQLAVGVAVSERWRAGLGVLALGELAGEVFISTDAAGRFASSSEQQLLAKIAPIAGARYLYSDRLTLGLTARGASRADYDITIRNDLGDSLPLSVPTLRIAGVSQYDPLSAAFEAAWRVSARLQVSGQLAYQRWSAFPLPTENPVETMPPQVPPGFRDIAVPRLAAEWALQRGTTRLTARAGYAFVPSPAPEMDDRQSLLDNHRHVVGAGVGIAWPGTRAPLYLDLWVQSHVLMPRTHEKDPSNFEPDEMLPFDTIDTGGSIAVGGVTLGVDL